MNLLIIPNLMKTVFNGLHDTCEWRDLSSFVIHDEGSFCCKTQLVCYLIMAALSPSVDAICL